MISSRTRKKKKIRPIDNTIYVIAANDIDPSIKDRILKIFGDDNKLVFEKDENMIGGIKIKQGVKLFDGTMIKHLNDLKRNLYNI